MASSAGKHAFGVASPDVALSFAGGAAPFTAAGAPIARDAALAGLGLRGDELRTLSVAIGCAGRISSGMQDDRVNSTPTLKF